MTASPSRRDRVFATLAGQPVDRPPMSFWGHFYDREDTARGLADATLEFRDRYDWDFVKLNPRATYHSEPWGVTFQASAHPLQKTLRTGWPVHAPADLDRIRPLPGDSGALGEQLEAIRLVRKGLPPDVLLVETVFSPLAIVTDLCENTAFLERVLAQDPQRVRRAMEAVTATFEDFVPRALAAGADGIYFATVEWATADRPWSAAAYREFAGPADLRVLARAAGAAFNVLHVCRARSFVRALADYPVHAVSWATTEDGNPNLRDGLGFLRGAAIGGLGHEDALVAPDASLALAQLEAGFAQTGGRRWIIAPGCSTLPHTPPERLEELRAAALRLAGTASREVRP